MAPPSIPRTIANADGERVALAPPGSRKAQGPERSLVSVRAGHYNRYCRMERTTGGGVCPGDPRGGGCSRRGQSRFPPDAARERPAAMGAFVLSAKRAPRTRPLVQTRVQALAEVQRMTLAPAFSQAVSSVKDRQNFAKIAEVQPIPDLIAIQQQSFQWFLDEGLRELFAEISPILDFTGKNMELELAVQGPNGEPGYSFGEPKLSEEECRDRDSTFAAPLRVRMRLTIKSGEAAGEIKEQEIFMGDFPMMTPNGTFIINGAERVVVSQLVRSPGVYFTLEEDPASGRLLCMGKLIPSRGAWLEFETSNKDVLFTKVDRKRKIPITTLLRAVAAVYPGSPLGRGTDEELLALYADTDKHPEHRYIQATIERDPAHSAEEALLEFYRRLRPGDPPNPDNARTLLQSLFFNFRRYDLGRVGRYKLNKRL